MEIDENAVHVFEHPGLDYQLNVCLTKIAREITDDDLIVMKYLLTGEQGTPRAVLEKITNPFNLFEHLKGRLLLSRDNLLFLQAMLYHAQRIDLFNNLLEFAKQRGETLHCYPESESPVNGYTFMKFHVAGTEKFNRSSLEAIRSTASIYMDVPTHFVTVQGIQATQSYLITFMVPIDCIGSVTTLNQPKKQCLISLGVDYIIIEGNTIGLQGANIDENQVPGIHLNEEQQFYFRKNISLGRQLLQYQLNDFNAGLKLTADFSASLTLLATILFNIVHNRRRPLVDTISMQNAYKNFRHGLKKVKGLEYDVNVIQSLLDAQSVIVRKQNLEDHRLTILQQQYQIQMLERAANVLRYERDKLKYFQGRSIHEEVLSRNDQFLLHGMVKSVSALRITQKIGVLDMHQLVPYLAEASKILSKKDTTRIKQVFQIDKQEENTFKQEGRCFLEALFIVESERKDGFINVEEFGQKVVEIVNKKEFEIKWNAQIQKFFLHCDQKQQRAERPTQTETKHRSKVSDRMTTAHDDSSEKIDQVLDKVDLVNKRLADIENLICNPLARLDMSRQENFERVGAHFAKPQTMEED